MFHRLYFWPVVFTGSVGNAKLCIVKRTLLFRCFDFMDFSVYFAIASGAELLILFSKECRMLYTKDV